MTDIDILVCSSIVEDIIPGKLLHKFRDKVNGKKRYITYCLVNGIYLHWIIFVDNIENEISNKENVPQY